MPRQSRYCHSNWRVPVAEATSTVEGHMWGAPQDGGTSRCPKITFRRQFLGRDIEKSRGNESSCKLKGDACL